MAAERARTCRSCASPDLSVVLDLGSQPIADVLGADESDALAAPEYPLRLGVCSRCWLVQLVDDEAAVSATVHGHGSEFSTSVRRETDAWIEMLVRRLGLGTGHLVTAIGAEADHVLARFGEHGIGTITFDLALANGTGVDLIVAQHALAHYSDLGPIIQEMSEVLATSGTAAIEFHDVRGMATGGQFDIACHAHRSYLSLTSLRFALERHDLSVDDAALADTHGGSVRVIARHRSKVAGPSAAAESILAAERAAGLDSLLGYREIAPRALAVREAFVAFLRNESGAGHTVAAYGAPARGTTLVNFCRVTHRSIAFTVDRDPRKQQRYLPGSGVPVLSPSALAQLRPDRVLILPWPLADEIAAQEAAVRSWGAAFVVALPELRILP